MEGFRLIWLNLLIAICCLFSMPTGVSAGKEAVLERITFILDADYPDHSNPLALQKGYDYGFRPSVIGTYSDYTLRDVTKFAQFTSSNEAIFKVSTDYLAYGLLLLYPVHDGTANLVVSYNQVTTTLPIKIVSDDHPDDSSDEIIDLYDIVSEAKLRSEQVKLLVPHYGERTLDPPAVTAAPLSDSQISLNWNEVERADYYVVYYSNSENGPYQPVLEANEQPMQFKETFFTDEVGLAHATRYYKVTAAKGGLESEKSEAVSATTFYNDHMDLDFIITDVVQDPDEPIIYATDKENRKLYAINYETKTLSSLAFDLPPESLTYAAGEIYVSLLKQEHSSYIWDEDQQGAIAIVDPSTLTVSERFDISLDPYDIAVNQDGTYIFVSSGSGQWTQMKSYSRRTLTEVSTTGIRQQSHIHLHPSQNKIYAIDTDVSPRDVEVFPVSDGKFLNGYDSPYHGDYPMRQNMSLSPDGRFIFNGAGPVFYASTSSYYDMKFVYSLDDSFEDIAFELNQNQFYASKGQQVIAYDYDNFLKTGLYHLDGEAHRLFEDESRLVALSKQGEKTILEIINKDAVEALPPGEKPDLDIPDPLVHLTGKIVDVLYDPSKDRVYALDEAFNHLFTVNLQTKAVERVTSLEHKPAGMSLSEDGSSLFIVNDDPDCLVTEVRLEDGQVTRKLVYSTSPDWGDITHRHIYNKFNHLYVVLGNWEPSLLIFNEETLKPIPKPDEMKGIGDMAFSETDGTLYYWYQYGWGAGLANSKVLAYSVSDNRFTKKDESTIPYPEFKRDPLDTPIFLQGGKLITKNKVFDARNLTKVLADLPEPIYAVSPIGDILAGKGGLYDATTYRKIETLSLAPTQELFYDTEDSLYYLLDNAIYRK